MPTQSIPFKQIDVFTKLPFKGNPVAVILDGNALDTATMQRIANWTNLSETTFVCKPTQPTADYRLRIFTPASEIPFAGHPTIGSAWAILQSGLVPKVPGQLVQECAKGLIPLKILGEKIVLQLPEPQFTELAPAELIAVAAALGISASNIGVAAIVDVGPRWLTLQLASAEEVIALKPDMAALSALARVTGVTAFGRITAFGNQTAAAVADIEVRSFAPATGVPEDPVCGSGNGAVAAMIRRHTLMEQQRYVASQGRCLGREGYVEVEYSEDGQIWLGGHAVTCIDGTIAL